MQTVIREEEYRPPPPPPFEVITSREVVLNKTSASSDTAVQLVDSAARRRSPSIPRKVSANANLLQKRRFSGALALNDVSQVKKVPLGSDYTIFSQVYILYIILRLGFGCFSTKNPFACRNSNSIQKISEIPRFGPSDFRIPTFFLQKNPFANDFPPYQR
jgi:hypothetical protein